MDLEERIITLETQIQELYQLINYASISNYTAGQIVETFKSRGIRNRNPSTVQESS